ncbi:Poly(A)-specific ribonuclease PARN [Rhynchospora pubera]|uniref:Poly(A)-specific ribonuclease PARN n=1 Tax=Rhynchospora pubera TaxID=906938 RepID=A0AAV8HUZ7_9POAL|nr:Poly(A)-specific ribonuclease PARN [Rhynchospora pubera]
MAARRGLLLRRPLCSMATSTSRKGKVEVKQVRRGDSYHDSLTSLIQSASFVALDAEMTGVASTPWRDSFEWDSADVRFLKLRHSASRFALLQFGLCPFIPQRDASSGVVSFVAHPHTFHLSPSSSSEGDYDDDDEFLCQTSSLHFLATHRHDFNTSLRHGLPYLSRAREKAVAAPPALRTESCAVGFRHLIDLLSSHNKLIVGHNCILDIAHMFDKFIAPIPSTMEQFMKEVHQIFPNIIDTKHIINANQTVQLLMRNKSKSLSSAFSSLCPTISSAGYHRSVRASDVNVKVQAHDDEGSSLFNSGAKHEAGYDAFMTGCVFTQLCVHLGITFDQCLSDPSISDPLQSNVKLKPYLNHLYPTWNSGTVLDFTTGTEKPEGTYKQKYPKVELKNIVLLWGFSSVLKYKNLKGCIAKVFGPDSVISVFFIDATAALIQFRKEEFVKDFLALKESLERRKDDPISILHPLSVIFEGGNTKAGDYNTYKDVIACNQSKVLFKDQADASGVAC